MICWCDDIFGVKVSIHVIFILMHTCMPVVSITCIPNRVSSCTLLYLHAYPCLCEYLHVCVRMHSVCGFVLAFNSIKWLEHFNCMYVFYPPLQDLCSEIVCTWLFRSAFRQYGHGVCFLCQVSMLMCHTAMSHTLEASTHARTSKKQSSATHGHPQ